MAALESKLEPVVAGMGFELVDVQASNGGRLLRVFIDKPGGVNVDDCAEVSRQLSRVLPVEGFDYERLEVSSPGLDRPLRKEADFARFTGHKADVRMRRPDATGRRRFIGALWGRRGACHGRAVGGPGGAGEPGNGRKDSCAGPRRGRAGAAGAGTVRI